MHKKQCIMMAVIPLMAHLVETYILSDLLDIGKPLDVIVVTQRLIPAHNNTAVISPVQLLWELLLMLQDLSWPAE